MIAIQVQRMTAEEKKSLNKDYRKRELLKITLENYVYYAILIT
jgi:hypothetical protein